MHVVKVDINVLGSSMRDWVPCNSDSSLVILLNGVFGVALTSDNSLLGHTASCVTALSATFSASAVGSVITGCFLLNQLIAPPNMTNRFPVVECQSSMSPAQSASENPIRQSSADLSCLNPRLIIPLR